MSYFHSKVYNIDESKDFETELVIHNLVCLINGCARIKGWYTPARISCTDDSYDADGESEVTIDDFTVIAYDDDGQEVDIELTDKEKSEIREELVDYAEHNLF